MRIGNLDISHSKPCRIIAELGTLNMSSMETLLLATESAFNHGADMVKVQLIDYKSAWWANSAQIARYKELYKGMEFWTEYFTEVRRRFKNPVIASAFDIKYLALNHLMPAWKLGWKANSMPHLIDETFKLSKPVIWSMNGLEYWRHGLESQVSMSDLRNEANFCREWAFSRRARGYSNRENVARLFVQTIYPCPVNKQVMPNFARGSNYHGLSYHGSDQAFLISALIAGAQLLEVHVATNDADGPDTSFALSLDKLDKLCRVRDNLSSVLSLAISENK